MSTGGSARARAQQRRQRQQQLESAPSADEGDGEPTLGHSGAPATETATSTHAPAPDAAATTPTQASSPGRTTRSSPLRALPRRSRAAVPVSAPEGERSDAAVSATATPTGAPAPETAAATPNQTSSTESTAPRSLLGRFSRKSRAAAPVGSARSTGDETADAASDERETTPLAPTSSFEEGDENDEMLLLGLTERIRPEPTRQTRSAPAEGIYLRPHSNIRRVPWHTANKLYRQPLSELEDGLHVETMPDVSARSQQLLAERLGSGFVPASTAPILPSGTVLRQPDPVRHVRVRPSHSGMIAEEVEMVRPRASMHLVDADSISSGMKHSLQVSIGTVQLHDHPLFRQEHVLQRRLRLMAEQLGELHQRETLILARRRVIDLRGRLDPLLASGPPQAGAEAARVRDLCVELLQARRERDEHECAERLLARRMLQVWQRIKVERRQQGFASTRAKLQVQLVKEEEDVEAELEEELEERRLLHALRPDGDDETFDELTVRSEIAERQRELRHAKGEDTLVPVYTEETPPTDYEAVPPAEKRRQRDAAHVQFYPVLLVDNVVVGTTRSSFLYPYDFCLRFNFSLQLQLLHTPQVLSLQLWQRRLAGLADFMVAEVFLSVPAVASPSAPSWRHYEFASERTFKAQDGTPAGAANADDSEIAAVVERCLCGRVAVSVAWASQPASVGRSSRPAQQLAMSYGTLKARGESQMSSGALDTVRVRNHIRADDLDPNAPEDAPLLALLSRSGRSRQDGAFRVTRLQRELQLMKQWMFTKRQRLLQLRHERPHEWQALPQGSRGVPSRDDEIEKNTYLDKLLQDGPGALAEGDEMDDTSKTSRLKQWARQVAAKQQRARSGKKFLLTTKDVVKEPLLELEVEAFDLNAFLQKVIAPRRKLLPRPRRRMPQPGTAQTERTLEVVVIDGVDLPVRAGNDAATRLCVQCSFQGQRRQTELKAGANPIWNQRLHFKITVPNGDWSEQSLLDMNADIAFDLFDRVEHSRRDDREQNVRSVREELRWLGSFTLPFATLYRAGEVKGVFALSMPPILLGYSKDERSTSKRLVPKSALQLFVTVDPMLPPPKAEGRELFTAQSVKLQQYAASWVKQVRTSLPVASRNRALTVFAPTATGERALVCRYIREQQLPPGTLMPNTDADLLRFVSLIPFRDDAALGTSLDVWNTTDSFLELCAGDAEEHAVMLCNLFLAKQKEAYVLLGYQVPQGETAYVLTRKGGEIRLWDVCNGRVYGHEGKERGLPLSECPLTAVGCIFNGNNVWANIQVSGSASEMTWNLSDPKCWRPFFSPRTNPQPETLQHLQTETLDYQKTRDEYVSKLELGLELKLEEQFENLRGHRETDWNKALKVALKNLLKRFELDAKGGPELTQAEHDAQLEKFLASYRIVGFPIHIAYMDQQPLLEREREGELSNPLLEKLRNTNLWMSESPKIKFTLAAYVHAYPNHVCSVWVYIAALYDKRAPR